MKATLQGQANLQSKKEPVPVELTIAAAWWASRTGDLSPEQASLFKDNLSNKLHEKYRGHWCIENPLRGNAFRAILFDETTCDRVLSNAAQSSFISQFERRLPAEAVVMWVDPGSVSIKYLSSQKVKILYDSTDPSYSKDALAAGSTPAAGAASSNSAETPSTACAQEYSSVQAAAAVSSIPAQRV